MFLGSYFANYVEFAIVDYPVPWMITPFVLMIPIPKSHTNLAAVWLPFDPEVKNLINGNRLHYFVNWIYVN